MAKTPTKAEHYRGSRYEQRTIKFEQIVFDSTHDLCHRDDEALKDDRIELLSASLVQEDMATPLTLAETEQFKIIDGEKLPLYNLVGGFRRKAAIDKAIADNLDSRRFHPGMEVAVVVLVRGVNQTQEAYDEDVLVCSVADNEQRASFTQDERLEIISRFVAAKIPKPRASSALNMSATNYDRYARVVKLPWLHKAVLDAKINLTDAAKLAETAEKHKRPRQFQAEFEAWVSKKQAQLDRERDEYKKLGRELKGPAAQLKKYLDPATTKAWDSSLAAGQPFMGSADGISFGVVIDEKNRMLDMPKISVSFDKLRSEDITEILAELQTSMSPLIQLRNRLRLQEQATVMSDDEIQQELLRLQELARERAAQKAIAEAGRELQETSEIEVTPPHDVAADIDDALEAIKPPIESASEADDGDDLERRDEDGRTDGDENEERKD
jgi:hypothetical protein